MVAIDERRTRRVAAAEEPAAVGRDRIAIRVQRIAGRRDDLRLPPRRAAGQATEREDGLQEVAAVVVELHAQFRPRERVAVADDAHRPAGEQLVVDVDVMHAVGREHVAAGTSQLRVTDQRDVGIGRALDDVAARERHGADPRFPRRIGQVEQQLQLDRVVCPVGGHLLRARAEHRRAAEHGGGDERRGPPVRRRTTTGKTQRESQPGRGRTHGRTYEDTVRDAGIAWFGRGARSSLPIERSATPRDVCQGQSRIIGHAVRASRHRATDDLSPSMSPCRSRRSDVALSMSSLRLSFSTDLRAASP